LSRNEVESIKDQEGFDRVFKQGRRQGGGLFTVIKRAGQGTNKLGIIVNSKYGGAVQRNRIKRKIREAFRLIGAGLKDRVEVVVMPKDQAKKAKLAEITEELRSLITGSR
jgi:ribonuclease P protein component